MTPLVFDFLQELLAGGVCLAEKNGLCTIVPL